MGGVRRGGRRGLGAARLGGGRPGPRRAAHRRPFEASGGDHHRVRRHRRAAIRGDRGPRRRGRHRPGAAARDCHAPQEPGRRYLDQHCEDHLRAGAQLLRRRHLPALAGDRERTGPVAPRDGRRARQPQIAARQGLARRGPGLARRAGAQQAAARTLCERGGPGDLSRRAPVPHFGRVPGQRADRHLPDRGLSGGRWPCGQRPTMA